jgi:hypothetical protein
MEAITVHYLVALRDEDGIVDGALCDTPDIEAHLAPSRDLVNCPDCRAIIRATYIRS